MPLYCVSCFPVRFKEMIIIGPIYEGIGNWPVKSLDYRKATASSGTTWCPYTPLPEMGGSEWGPIRIGQFPIATIEQWMGGG